MQDDSNNQFDENFSEEELDIQPGVGLYALFPSLDYKPWVAIGEMVDNSIQSFIEHKTELLELHGPSYKLRIDINFINGENPEIHINDNAAGISEKDMHRAFKPAMPPVNKTGISQYGIGMKSSACWYSSHFTVKTQALGEAEFKAVTFDIHKIVENSISKIFPVRTPIKNPKSHGTQIILRKLNQPLPTSGAASRVRSYMKSIYRDFLRSGEVVITINGDKLDFDEIKYLRAPYWPNSDSPGTDKEIEWVKEFSVALSESFVPSFNGAEPPIVTGKIGILSKGDTKKAGLSLLWRRRVVQGAGNIATSPDDVYRPQRLFGSSNAYRKQRLIGELDVSQLRVTTFKDAIVWGAGQEEELLEKIRKEINSDPHPMLKMAENYRASENSKSALNQIEKTLTDVVGLAAKSLLTEAEGVFGYKMEEVVLDEIPEPQRQNDSIVISKTMILIPNFENDIMLELKDEARDTEWLRVREDSSKSTWLLTVNRAHPFMQSFTVAAPESLEPVLRLALAIGISEIKGRSAGMSAASIVRLNINDLLRSHLSTKGDIEVSFEDEE